MSSSDHLPTTQQRLIAHLGNQSAPPSLYGKGRKVLFRCPACRSPWMQDGSLPRLRLSAEELLAVSQELGADLACLPEVTCRLCAFAQGGGVFEVDEYGGGRSYGFNWEAAEPLAHVQAAIVSSSCMQEELSPDVILDPRKAKAVLRWLSQVKTFPLVRLLSPHEAEEMNRGSNQAGQGMTGTERWEWKGAFFQLFCPPLEDQAIVMLAIALPEKEPLSLPSLITLWKRLAKLAAEEPPDEKQAP